MKRQSIVTRSMRSLSTPVTAPIASPPARLGLKIQKKGRGVAPKAVSKKAVVDPSTDLPTAAIAVDAAAADFAYQLYKNYDHAAALAHLGQQDPAFAAAFARAKKVCPWVPEHEEHATAPGDAPAPLDPTETAFRSLLKTIVYQQLSDKSASAIHRRVLALFPGAHPTPAQVLAAPLEALRGAGLSGSKADYVRSLAAAFEDGLVQPALFDAMSDAQIVEALVQIRGIGEWSAQMVLMFTLKRCDVFPVGDLAIRKAAGAHFRDEPELRGSLGNEVRKGKGGKAGERALEAVVARRWAPYRSLGSWLMWQMLDQSQDTQ